MGDVSIRKAVREDIPRILSIYERARSFMEEQGNGGQWGRHYPAREDVEEDIARESSYLLLSEGRVVGVFCFFIGEEPSYREITGEGWHSDSPSGRNLPISGSTPTKEISRCSARYGALASGTAGLSGSGRGRDSPLTTSGRRT